MNLDSVGVVVYKFILAREIQPPNDEKMKRKTNTKFLELGHEPLGPSPGSLYKACKQWTSKNKRSVQRIEKCWVGKIKQCNAIFAKTT
jgi:hypothetical protein